MPEARVFLGWDAPALPAAVRWLADAYVAGEELPLRASVIALPGARAGRRLKELLVEEAARRGVRLAPPRVTTIGHLPELLLPPARPPADGALARMLWAETLRGLPPAQAERLVAALPATDDHRGWLALARELEALHATVAAGALTFADVAERCPEHQRDRWLLLADLQHAWMEGLARHGRVDRDLARVEALGREAYAALDPLPDLWLLGVAEMPAAVRRVVASLPAGRVRALVHAPEELADAFDALGCVLPDAWASMPIPVRDDQLEPAADPAAQAAAAVRFLAGLEGARAAEEISVAVPDDEVVPYLAEALAEAGVPARHARGVPLRRTAPYRFLAALADVIESGESDATAALARHPDLWRWVKEHGGELDGADAEFLGRAGAWLPPLDRYAEEHLPARMEGRWLAGGAGSRERRGTRAVLAVLERMAASLAGERPLREWMQRILDLLLDVYAAEPLRRHLPEERLVLAACTALRDAAAPLAHLPAALDPPCPAGAALRILLDEAGSQWLPPEPDREAVELLGWLEMHLDDAPVAVLTGVNEPHLPESVTADPFLPDALRSALGLEDNAMRYARDAYRMRAVLASRERVRVVVGRRSAAGDPLRPSRLLLATSGPDLARRVLRFAAEEEDGAVAPPRRAGGPGAPSRFVLPPEPEIRAGAPPERIPVTAFRALLQDPYLYGLERVLKLREQDDAARELDPLRFGTFAHEVLQEFGKDPARDSADAGLISRRLDELLDAAARARFGRTPRPAVRLQMEQLRARLHAFAAWHAGWVAEGWRVHAVECATEEGVPFHVDGEPILLTGRIDRIDHHPERDAWAVFDYKTGDRARPPEETHRRGRPNAKEWVDLQLPMYRHILPAVVDASGRPVFTGDPERVRLGYILLCADAEQVGAELAEWSAEALAEADEAARSCVQMLRNDRFVWDPDVRSLVGGDVAALLGLGRLVPSDDDEALEPAGGAS